MPIREFKCDEGHITEKLMMSKREERQVVKCKVCGERTKRIVSTGYLKFAYELTQEDLMS